MLKKSLVLLSAPLIMFSGVLFAAPLDKATISDVHVKMKDSIKSKCMSEMDGATNDSCDCLADKAQKSLDDGALGKCENSEAGSACVVDEVKKATMQALAPDSMAACKKGSSAPVASEPAPASSASSSSAASSPATPAPAASDSPASTSTAPTADKAADTASE